MLALKHLALLASALVTSTDAASVSLTTSSEGDSPFAQGGRVANIGLFVQWIGVPTGCQKKVTYNARTGKTIPLLAYREFDGDHDFHGNLDIISWQPGLKVGYGSKEIKLGPADKTEKLSGGKKKLACALNGYRADHPQNELSATFSTWDNVGSLGPCRD
jgi:hypothetical protein